MATLREAIRRVNQDLDMTLGLMRDVARDQPKVRHTTKTERNLNEELQTERLTTNEE